MCSTRVHCVNTCVSALSEHTGEHDVFMNTRSNTMYFHSKYFSSGAPVALDTRIHGYTDTRIHCVPSSDIMIFMAVISNIVCGITAMIFLTPSVVTSKEDAISCWFLRYHDPVASEMLPGQASQGASPTGWTLRRSRFDSLFPHQTYRWPTSKRPCLHWASDSLWVTHYSWIIMSNRPCVNCIHE